MIVDVRYYVNSLLQTQSKRGTKTVTVRAGIKLQLQKPCASENNYSSKQQRPIPINFKINTRYLVSKNPIVRIIPIKEL